MNRTSLRGLLAATLCWVLGTSSLLAWDPAGHMVIGQIAWEDLSPATRQKVSEILGTLPNQYNNGQTYNFVTSGCWMDDMRAMPNYPWAKWHYVTIPWTPDGKQFALPSPPHVVWAIDSALANLREPGTSAEKRTEALAMLIHFVQDVHQPLHATDRNNDRGGNGFLIANLQRTDNGPAKIATLHYFWDAAYRLTATDDKVTEIWHCPPVPGRPSVPGEGIIAEEAGKIRAQFPKASLEELRDPAKQNATEWARESHVAGCLFGYPAGQEPSDTELHVLPADFVTHSRDIAVRRVAVAGYRLAAMLNALFDK